ncbi:MAG: hypothetical protein CMN57_12455 [Gammaproteobacteria bacterium]|nr:hypothetical protein [Gammaproteobacteria bacterium]
MAQDIEHLTAALAQFYAELAPADLERVDEFYAPDAHFRDPFNDVHGTPAIRAIYRHMFTQLHDPRFEILHWACRDDWACMLWRFRFSARRLAGGRPLEVEGMSRVRFDAAGRVAAHHDYWDATAIYRHIPVLRGMLALLQRRLSATG